MGYVLGLSSVINYRWHACVWFIYKIHWRWLKIFLFVVRNPSQITNQLSQVAHCKLLASEDLVWTQMDSTILFTGIFAAQIRVDPPSYPWTWLGPDVFAYQLLSHMSNHYRSFGNSTRLFWFKHRRLFSFTRASIFSIIFRLFCKSPSSCPAIRNSASTIL